MNPKTKPIKQSLKEVNEEILKIMHSIKQETNEEILAMDEIATDSSLAWFPDINLPSTGLAIWRSGR